MNYSTNYFVPNHDPILGIRQKNIAEKINQNNWQRKAIVAGDTAEQLYIYIAPAEVPRLNRKLYCATGYSLDSGKIIWREAFQSPDEAIGWINRQYG